jgi:hypothetical protein
LPVRFAKGNVIITRGIIQSNLVKLTGDLRQLACKIRQRKGYYYTWNNLV